jgi:hypothetical protein
MRRGGGGGGGGVALVDARTFHPCDLEAQGRGPSIHASEEEVAAHCWGEDEGADVRTCHGWKGESRDLRSRRLCSAAAARTAAGL